MAFLIEHWVRTRFDYASRFAQVTPPISREVIRFRLRHSMPRLTCTSLYADRGARDDRFPQGNHPIERRSHSGLC